MTRGAAVAVVLLLALGGCGGPPADDGVGPTGPADATTDPGVAASPSPGASAEDAAPAQSAGAGTGTARAATAADAAAYLASADPEGVRRLLGIAVDLDGDEQREVLLHGVRGGRGWLGVAAWDGTAFGLVAQVLAGPARRTEDLHVADVNADGEPELVLTTSGDGTTSLALWSARRPDRLVPLDAVGGCVDGSNVYGVLGAELVETGGEALDVVATCDDSPLPVADWSRQRWRWSDGAYRLVPDAPGSGVDPAPEPATPSPSPSAPPQEPDAG